MCVTEEIQPLTPDLIDVPELDDSALASPLVKIPGGKSDLVVELSKYMPTKIKKYVEPFGGGLAEFFYLYREGRFEDMKWVSLADFDEHLIELYTDVQKFPEDLFKKLQTIHATYQKSPEACYYHVRQLWNNRDRTPAKNVFLRQASFNGLWRHNKKGEMNAPWGKRAKLALPSLEKLIAVSHAFQKVSLNAASFGTTLDQDEQCGYLEEGTVVYVDPPYLETWNSYTAEGWNAGHAILLLRLCKKWSDGGAQVVLSHADVPSLRDLLKKEWPSGIIEVVERRNRINSNGAGRGPVPELIVHSR